MPVDLRTRLIIVNSDNRTVGLIVDTSREFISIPDDAIQPPPEGISGLSGKYIQGIATLNKRIIIILELKEILNSADAVLMTAQEA
jgi:purine-binding chemotaxis protein CheW